MILWKKDSRPADLKYYQSIAVLLRTDNYVGSYDINIKLT